MHWVLTDRETATLDDVLANAPAVHEAFGRFNEALWSQPYLPAPIMELCRLRLARLHGCDAELRRRTSQALAAGLDESKVAALPRWPDDPRFDAAEKACLGFAEVYFQDPGAITDELADAVKTVLGEPALVALVEALGIFDGFTRLSVLLDASPQTEETDA